MVVADARAIIPSLEVLDDKPGLSENLLKGIAAWCIRYTPVVAIDPPDGILLDVTGCAHLWGGEDAYLADIRTRLKTLGYTIRAAIADTIGAAWAIARFGNEMIVPPGNQSAALGCLPPVSLRLEPEIIERLQKLGLRQVNSFASMPRAALRRRFGASLLLKLDQALGYEDEVIVPIQPIELYHERLPCLEPIVTATGIGIALQQLLDILCKRLRLDNKGLRNAVFTGFRVDGRIERIEINTIRASNNIQHSINVRHYFDTIEAGLGSIYPS